jgi:hypothetical protein
MDSHQIDFDRQWPDGWNGPAMPHGSLFSRSTETIECANVSF